jgi:hypothetical protein
VNGHSLNKNSKAKQIEEKSVLGKICLILVNKVNSLYSLFKGLIVQLFEYFLIQIDKNAGEEIVVTLVKR